jgi:prefoldin subunit 5
MSDEIDIEQMAEELKEYKKQLDTLKAEFELLVRHSPTSITQIISVSNQINNSAFDQDDVMKCKRFVEKYGLRIG